MELEKSDGKIIQNPGKEEIDRTIADVGGSLDFCILSNGDTFIQTAASAGGLLLQFRDSGGMFESVQDKLETSVVQDCFRQFLDRQESWKTALEFSPMEGGADDQAASGRNYQAGGDQASGKEKSFTETLADAVKSEAMNSVNRAARKITRNVFKKLF